MPFAPDVKEEALLRSGRRCCVCLRFKGVRVEVHHIVPEAKSHDNSLRNAITLCFDCHADAGHYNPKHPKGSKFRPSELRKHRDRLWRLVANGKIPPEGNLDAHFLAFIAKAFDRAAFKTPFRQEGRMESFDKAIDDTLLAINTGVLRTRDNQIVADVGFGKSALVDADWRKSLNQVERRLHRLRASVAKALAAGDLKSCHEYCYCGNARTIDGLDAKRADIIRTINLVLSSAGILPIENVLARAREGRQKSPKARSAILRRPRRIGRR
jgi:hypothetical protein